VNACEAFRVEPLGERLDRPAHEVLVRADVQIDVVLRRFDPVDVGGVEKEDPSRLAHDEPRERRIGTRGFPHMRGIRRAAAARDAHRAFDRRVEALLVERLEQVVERVHFERAQRVLVIGGSEDHERQLVVVERCEDVEAGARGELDVEEQQLGAETVDERHRFVAVGRDADDFHVVASAQQAHEARAGEALVLNDQRADRVHGEEGLRW
jgi:hypothetical protein